MMKDMLKSLPLFKSHFSLGRSILTLEAPPKKPLSYPISIFDLLKQNNLDTLTLVDDCISGLLQASKQAAESKVKLIFGLRLDICEDMNQKDEPSLLRRAKYIVFARNPKGYEALVKIWSAAAREGFYYSPNIDFKTLRSLWNKNLRLAVPFYDSFLYLNAFCSHAHVPEFDKLGKLTFFIEDNDLPFDDMLAERVKKYCSKNGHDTMKAQSIFYKSEEDYLAYIAFRCLHNRGYTQKCTLERPELDHMNSTGFNFDRWLKDNS
jgi:DNA polymerase III alpha subunit